MTDDLLAVQRSEATYERLAEKLMELGATLPADEQSALLLLVEHAKEHATATTGYEFDDVEPDTQGYVLIALSPNPAGFAGGVHPLLPSLGGIGQFGRISGNYMPASVNGDGRA